jgi:hypothetical protein
MMYLDDSKPEVPLSGWKPEFNWVPPASSHSSTERTPGLPPVSSHYDYRHLVGDPTKPYDSRPDSGLLDGLLTEFDQILLRFGMHIVW